MVNPRVFLDFNIEGQAVGRSVRPTPRSSRHSQLLQGHLRALRRCSPQDLREVRFLCPWPALQANTRWYSFRQLCTGAAGVSAAGDPLHYKSSLIHRVVANFMVAGGDIVSRNGKGSESIYGGLFDDEDLSREIDVEG